MVKEAIENDYSDEANPQEQKKIPSQREVLERLNYNWLLLSEAVGLEEAEALCVLNHLASMKTHEGWDIMEIDKASTYIYNQICRLLQETDSDWEGTGSVPK